MGEGCRVGWVCRCCGWAVTQLPYLERVAESIFRYKAIELLPSSTQFLRYIVYIAQSSARSFLFWPQWPYVSTCHPGN